jgi:NADPH-dependent curcumin reductase CurA
VSLWLEDALGVTDAVNSRIVLKGRPRGGVVGADLFAGEEAARPEPGPGELLIRVIYLSLDPAMRGWIAEAPNYREPVPLGAVMPGFTVGEVVASRHPDYGAGEFVLGRQGWQAWAVSDGGDIHRKLDPAQGPISAALHVLGHTGLTAYLGLTTVGQPKPGETVVVSTAAGAVGSVVGQVAKLKGCRTVGLTGSPEKVRLCREDFGYDAAIDYKIALLPTGQSLSEAIARSCPDGVDVYFDNVGGEIADAVLEHINVGARIVVCGTTGIADVEPGALQPRAAAHGAAAEPPAVDQAGADDRVPGARPPGSTGLPAAGAGRLGAGRQDQVPRGSGGRPGEGAQGSAAPLVRRQHGQDDRSGRRTPGVRRGSLIGGLR